MTEGVRRRTLLFGGLAGAGGLMVGAAGATAATTAAEPPPDAAGAATVPFHGPHQAGVTTPAQAHVVLVALDLRPGVDRAALGRLLRLWTDDAARLAAGRPALADTEPELAAAPARLTVTFGFGAGVFAAAGLPDQAPAGVAGLPPFPVDRLEERWSGGDLLLQVCADDAVTVAHGVRMLVKDGRAFATVRWTQRGFLRGPGVTAPGTTPRNLMGQVDGTGNPQPTDGDFERTVWVSAGTGGSAPAWLRGGTTVVVRRIAMDLDAWDALDRDAREQVVGRRLDTGAPLTGTAERDPVDLRARNAVGLPVIPAFAHVRLAHPDTTGVRILRRGYNYDDGLAPDGAPDAGLLFVSFQADVTRQFVPIQRSLAASDLLNTWTTPVGSAVFAVPPGCRPGGWIGETLLG